MASTNTPIQTLTFEEAFEAEVRPAIHRVEEKTGDEFFYWYQPIQGELVSEFTDIRWAAVQMLMYWARDSETDFETCAREFMKDFQAEMRRLLGKESWPLEENKKGLVV
jgi:hypothetical protein